MGAQAFQQFSHGQAGTNCDQRRCLVISELPVMPFEVKRPESIASTTTAGATGAHQQWGWMQRVSQNGRKELRVKT